jgi:hypothetical protein
MRLGWALLVAAAASMGAAYATLEMLNLRAPTVTAGVAGVSATPRPALVVVIDGLGADEAARLPALAAPDGAWVELSAEPPTFSSAQYVAFLTGVGPVDSGVRTNLRPRRSPLDTVMAGVRARGGRAVAVSDGVDWWGRLFEWDEAVQVPPARLLAEASRLIADPRNQLVLVHPAGVDRAGHRTGAASLEYRRAAIDAADQVTALAARWGRRGPILVLSDHGHMPRGGHGGSERPVRRAFLAMSGPGVRPGAHVDGASTMDVAPTLAALLGVPAPAHAVGRTLFQALDLGGDAGAIAEAERHRLSVVLPAAARGREALAAAERRGRYLRAGMAALVLAAAAWWLRRLGAPAARGLLHGAGAAALLAALIALVAGRISFSSFRSLKMQAVVVGCLGFCAGLAALAAPLRAAWRGKLPAARAVAAGVAVGASPAAVAAFALAGITAPRFACRPDWVAAGPTMAYLGLGPILICAAALVLAARWSGR